jgi:hypothetical protein
MDMDARSMTVKQDIVNELAEFARKPFNWNGDHSLPVRPDVVDEIAYRLLGTYGIDFRGLPDPEMFMGNDGSIALVFRKGRRTLKVCVKCAGIIHCFAESHHADDVCLRDKLVRLPKTTPATGYAVEVDEWADWLLGLEDIG